MWRENVKRENVSVTIAMRRRSDHPIVNLQRFPNRCTRNHRIFVISGYQ